MAEVGACQQCCSCVRPSQELIPPKGQDKGIRVKILGGRVEEMVGLGR